MPILPIQRPTLDTLRAERAVKVSTRWPICTMADGAPLSLPVHAAIGARPGPLFVVLATQHGNEYLPILGLKRIWDEIDPGQMVGDLVLLPVANPNAFEFGTRCSRLDGMWGDNGNMNRVWPGKPNGWLTERLADAVFQQFLKHADCVLDLHSSYPGVGIYYAYTAQGDDPSSRRQAELARALGMELLMCENRRAGTLSDCLLSHGTLLLAAEVGTFSGRIGGAWMGDPVRYPRYSTEVTATAVHNVLRALKMLPGRPDLPRHQVLVSPELALRVGKGGVLQPLVNALDIGIVVPRGTPLAEVTDPWTMEIVETLVAPFERTVLIACSDLPMKVNPGDYGVWVSDWDTAVHFTADGSRVHD